MSLKENVKKIPGIMTIRNFQLAFSASPMEIFHSHKKIKRYKNLYKGRRCFVIGNGPSLTAKDLDLLKNEISFAANTIYKIFPYTSWRPTFFCLQDENILRKIADDDLYERTKNCKAAFVRMHSSQLIKENNIKINNIIYVPIWSKLKKNYAAPFSSHADILVYDGSMVTYLSLQLAVYMGFENIYLIGMDHNFPFHRKKDGTIEVNDLTLATHFWEGAKDNDKVEVREMRVNYHELAENSYREAEAFSRKNHKFRIYNATRGGKLEVFERVNLEDIL